MNIVCLDMEGVVTPEIWIAFSEESGIPELRRTTRDEPDYDKLMRWRLQILKAHGLGLKEIQEVISRIDPLPGAKKFLDELRKDGPVIILSDTFEQFAAPLIAKLGYPLLMCNTLEVAPDGEITGFTMRTKETKRSTVLALKSIGYDVIAFGDSYNDLPHHRNAAKRVSRNSRIRRIQRSTQRNPRGILRLHGSLSVEE